MPTLTAYDGTPLALHLTGDEGPPLVCLPGGPMQDSAYLGDLGGLASRRCTAVLDLRGTGHSAAPEDKGSYRCDRQVDDVEAVREHLGLDRLDLLGHSAGANLAVLYAARHPHRVRRLVLVTPSVYAVGLEVPAGARLRTARLRGGEPWFPQAYEALEGLAHGRPAENAWEAIAPFFHRRWDEADRAHRAAEDAQRNDEAAAVFGAEGAYDPRRGRPSPGFPHRSCSWPARRTRPPRRRYCASTPPCSLTPP